MGKKSARRSSEPHQSNVRAIHTKRDEWSPIFEHDRRDYRYVRNIKPKNENQRAVLEALDSMNLVVIMGPAGTGKTYLSVARAVEDFEDGLVNRIVLTRPAVEAGETLGFLPGNLESKMSPYLRPLFDSLSDRLGGKQLRKLIADGLIEIAPIGYMRGRTLNNAFVIIDEAQNCTYGQLKMLVTRLGWNSTMVISGDTDQSDLLPGLSGLADIANRLESLPDVAVLRLTQNDVVRHPLVTSVLSVV